MKLKLSEYLHQPWFGGGLGALLTAGIGVILCTTPVGKTLQDASYDIPFVLRVERIDKDVAVIYLDETSYKILNGSPDYFDRTNHAQLLKSLKTQGVKLVVFDILFIDKNKPTNASDHVFAQAIRDFGNVVLGAQYDEDAQTERDEAIPPLDIFVDATPGSNSWGVVKIHRDSDFAARRIHPGSTNFVSLAWKAAELYGAKVARNPEKRGDERWMNYYAKEPFAEIPYWDVIKRTMKNKAISWTNKVVFVGSGADIAGFTGEEKEQVRYPWTWLTGHHPAGVEVHAQTFCNLIHGNWLTRLPQSWEVIIIILVGIILGEGLTFYRPLPATGFAIGAALAVFALALGLFTGLNIWFSWLILVGVQIPVALGWSLFFHSINSYIEKQVLTQSLVHYLSPHHVKRILKQPELLQPGGEQKIVSILFSDIEGFSNISEHLHPADLLKQLNDYYEAAISCIQKTDGAVMNLIGDAIFAIWNAPLDQEDHQERACRAAILLNEKLIEFNTRQIQPFRTRVGLHTGVVSVGNIGSRTRFEYTAIGDSVNMASRLEGLNKRLGTSLLATRDIQMAVEKRLVSRFVGYFKFQGLVQEVEVHEMIATLENEEASRAWRESFKAAWILFRDRSWEKAAAQFEETLTLRPRENPSKPSDGPSDFYLKLIKEFEVAPPPKDWKLGVVNLQGK